MEWITPAIFGSLLVALSAFFWNDRNTTQRRIDSVESNFGTRVSELEKKVDKQLEDIKSELKDINHKLDVGSGMERPAEKCRNYLAESMFALKTDLKEIVATTIQLEVSKVVKQSRQAKKP